MESKVVATETSLPGVTLGHLAMAEKQYLGLTFLQVIVVMVVRAVRAVMMVMVVKECKGPPSSIFAANGVDDRDCCDHDIL